MGHTVLELQHLIHGYQAMIEWGADIVHDHTLIGPLYTQLSSPFPVVTTNHGPFGHELIDLYRCIGNNIPIIAISADQARRALDVPIAAVIHHGIDLDAFPVGDGDGDDAGNYFLYLGRMAPEKGARQAVDAARRTGQRLIVAAKMREPAERDFFATQVEPLLGERITFIGEVDGPTRLSLLQGATALLNPIRWAEPFGLVMIEALACGTPVLTFAEGSAPELIVNGRTGFVCHDVAEMAMRMQQAHHLDRATCRLEAVTRFSTERMALDHLQLFEHIIAGERGGVRAGLLAL
jgi:glycosyltransferase involved in cell wall biosynthesis